MCVTCHSNALIKRKERKTLTILVFQPVHSEITYQNTKSEVGEPMVQLYSLV